MKQSRLTIALLSLGLVSAACAQDGAGGGQGQEDAGTGGTITVEMKDFAFQPGTLEGEEGQTVTVSLHNEDDVAHTFTVESQGVDVEVEPGGAAEVEVTFGAQAVPFVCRFHQAGGMTGQLGGEGQAEPSASPEEDMGGGGGFDPYG